MFQNSDITVQRISSEQQMGPNGELREMVRVTFLVRGQGPFSVVEPEQGFSAELVKQRIEAKAREILALLTE
jgi:hypothetical protein